MAEHTARRAVGWALAAPLGLLVAAHLVFFAVHAVHMLGYRYPLDYGEGPLLAQVEQLRAGTPVWRLYGDPAAPPYLVVNYPPLFPLLAALLAVPLGSPLLAGRVLSLLAAAGCLAALWALGKSQEPRAESPAVRQETDGLRFGARAKNNPPSDTQNSKLKTQNFIPLLFLCLPIVREWAVVMRVDMLGICLGLLGLVALRRGAGRAGVAWAAGLLLASLYVKPSLIAAPAAALLWLAWRDRRRALLLGALLLGGGALLFGLLQAASGGWFALHVLTANANAWELKLAQNFWRDQLAILWPLIAAGLLGAALAFQQEKQTPHAEATGPHAAVQNSKLKTQNSTLPLALYYTAFGAVTALGVGKVGAYANYFLELYAGLVWLIALGLGGVPTRAGAGAAAPRPWLAAAGQWLLLLLAAGGLLRYYPSWSQTYSKPAGMIEGVNPPRLAFGRYGIWQDLRREANLLLTLGAANTALDQEVRAAGAPIFTDVPGVAAQAGRQARIQAFEHRQLADSGAWDQRALLLDLANGRVPLVVLDYLGNWLTPEVIALIRHRYAQDGSRGSYDLYRPVDPGPRAALDLPFPGGLRLDALYLSPPPGRAAYQPGELLTLTLGWANTPTQRNTQNSELSTLVVVRLLDAAGAAVLEERRPLLYGALAPAGWPAGAEVQHMQPLRLPPELPPGQYALEVALWGADGGEGAPQRVARIALEEGAGQTVGQHFIPAPLLDAWRRAGPDGLGEPLMPAVPFEGVVTQCYERGCLRLRGGRTEPLPLGELVRLADLGVDGEQPAVASPPATPEGPFGDFWTALGGASALGPPVSGELRRGDKLVLYTSYARLERPLDSDNVRIANVGVDYLRLPSIPYRWP